MKSTFAAAGLITIAMAMASAPAHGQDASTHMPSVQRPNTSLQRNKVYFWDGKMVEYATWRALLRGQYLAYRKPKGKR